MYDAHYPQIVFLPQVTLPLLAWELLQLAQGPVATTTFVGPHIELLVCLSAFATIALSFVNLLCFGDWDTPSLSGSVRPLRALLFLISNACMTLVIVVILVRAAQSETVHITQICIFLSLWFFYPVFYILAMAKFIPHWALDICLSGLDGVSKSALAFYVVFFHVE